MFVIIQLSLILNVAYTFNFEGLIPNEYMKDTELEIFAGRLDSIKTHLPFDYYYLNFCEPDKIEYTNKGVGDSITGDNLANTPYKVISLKINVPNIDQYDGEQNLWGSLQEFNELHIIWKL